MDQFLARSSLSVHASLFWGIRFFRKAFDQDQKDKRLRPTLSPSIKIETNKKKFSKNLYNFF